MRRRNSMTISSIINPMHILIISVSLILSCDAELITTIIQPQNTDSSIFVAAAQKQVELVKVKSMNAAQTNNYQGQRRQNGNKIDTYDAIGIIPSKNPLVTFKYQSSTNLPKYGGMVLLDLIKDDFYTENISGNKPSDIIDSNIVKTTQSTKNSNDKMQKTNDLNSNSMMTSSQAKNFNSAMQGSQKSLEKIFQNFR